MLAWLRLLRIPNLATAAADPLAGYLVVSQARALDWPPPACWLAVGAVVALYAAGMVLNDVCDAELDRRERPERPLPSGAITVSTAAAVGWALLAVGAALSGAAAWLVSSPWPAIVGVGLAAAIWLYDRHAKATPAGPLVMGGCRAAAWLLGMTAAAGPTTPAEWMIPAGMGLYVAGITLYARDEAGRSRQATLAAATVVMLAGLAVAAGFVWLPERGPIELTAGTRMPVASWLLLWTLIGTSILYRAALGAADPAVGRVRFAIGNAIMSIITLDAVLVLAACGERWAIVVLCLLAWFLFWKRLVPPT
ncbi:MAG: UbiA family prenyltransferase [Planctomycetota bacterium]